MSTTIHYCIHVISIGSVSNHPAVSFVQIPGTLSLHFTSLKLEGGRVGVGVNELNELTLVSLLCPKKFAGSVSVLNGDKTTLMLTGWRWRLAQPQGEST